MNMDWYSIEFLFPNSYRDFIESMFPNVGIISVSTLYYFDTKKLYRYFDKKGIFLTTELFRSYCWGYTISLQNGVVFGPSQEFKNSREEIESDGFMECFKILDKMLMDTI